MVQRFGPHMNEGGAVISLTYNASNRIIPGYGGGMSTAKAVSRAPRALPIASQRAARGSGGVPLAGVAPAVCAQPPCSCVRSR
jgi:hypothetical protein